MKRSKAILVLCCLFLATNVARPEIPIVAFCGVPPSESNEYRFKEFKAAGFDISIENYGNYSADRLKHVLDLAHQCGIRLIMKSNLALSQPQSIVPQLKSHPALYAYYIKDEPSPSELNEVGMAFRKIRAADPSANCYMNLFPQFSKASEKVYGVTYGDYLKKASTLGLPQLSFDHYPITTDGLRDTWYHNLEQIRQTCLKTKKPFWAFVLCTPHYHYPQPTLAMLRLQIYSNLAYGAQGIQYFTYWNPAPSGKFNYHDAPISREGNRTKNYYLVKSMNQELRLLLPVFDGAKVVSVNHMVAIPQGTTRLSKPPKNVKRIKATGEMGALVSTFTNNGHTYMMLVNKDYTRPLSIELQTNAKVVQLKKDLSTTQPMTQYKIEAGDMLLFQLD